MTQPPAPSGPRAAADALAQVVAIARAAGARLRAELHRPGGPRGTRGHAPIDAEVELDLCAALRAAFPGDGVRGEEHPEADTAPAPGGGLWLVDPNDGTGPFLQRQRGASVSIGRIVAGVPVLGVVYAYAWPDDRGSLLAWAEGAGPPTLNGVPLSAAPPPPVWWVSNTAERKATALARALGALPGGPRRFAPGPGVAFRLAQVALGGGELGLSVFAPRDFDVAGGHALVRGAGGVMVDGRLRPQAYATDRPTRAASVFAGSLAATARGTDFDWAALLRASDDVPDPLGPLAPGGAPLCADAERLTRAQGAWLGLLVAAAQGAAFSGQPDAAAEDALAFARAAVRGPTPEHVHLLRAAPDAPLRGVALGLLALRGPAAVATLPWAPAEATATQAGLAAAVAQAVRTGAVDVDALTAELGRQGHPLDPTVAAAVRGGGPGGGGDLAGLMRGALHGARHGLAAFSRAEQMAVLTCRPVAGLPDVSRPTPPRAWPTDALVLAERLITDPD